MHGQQANYELDIREIRFAGARPDTFSLSFNIYKLHETLDRERFHLDLPGNINFRVEETRGTRRVAADEPEYLEGSLQLQSFDTDGEQGFPDDITISLLVDRSGSISQDDMRLIREAVREFVFALPEGSVFLSYFHNFISPTYQLSRATFKEAADTLLVARPEMHTDLHNAVITKILEFDTLAAIPNQIIDERYGYIRKNDIARRGSKNNVLILLSDGWDDCGIGYNRPNPKYHPHPDFGPPDPMMNQFEQPDEVYDYIRTYRNQVTVFTIGYGAALSNFMTSGGSRLDEILEEMASSGGGSYHYVTPDKILDLLKGTLPAELMPDFSAKFVNPPHKIFRGLPRTLHVTLEAPGFSASGSKPYLLGSFANPIEVQSRSILQIMAWGVIAGLILILLVLIIIQLIWPLINNQLFMLKYRKRYIPPPAEQKRTCPYCLDPIHERDLVIKKCDHIVHHSCWNTNDHMCPEFGQNCTAGKQNYFDINDPFARKNKVFYLNWVFYGLLGGFFSYVAYLLVKDLEFWHKTVNTMVNWFAGEMHSAHYGYEHKLAPLYPIGTVLGFFLTFLFAWAEDFRKKKAITVFLMLVRSVIGSLIGFIAFIIGSLFIILLGKPEPYFLVDWIPWLIFGVLLGLSLSVKTTIHWKHGLLGGLFSIIFSFIMLYSLGYTFAGVLSYIAPIISFMLYGAGLGGSIATVRSTAEQYFLKILNGPKSGTHIAIHKWMSSQSGLNEVYIGSANACEIQMNWEKSNEIAGKHAKIYLNLDRKMPVIVSLEKGATTLYDDRVEMIPGKEYDLLNSTTFTISETAFQYVEKRDQ